MTSPVVTVLPTSTVREIAGQFAEHGIGIAPVVDHEGHVVGIVSNGDLNRKPADDAFARAYGMSRELTAQDVMTKRVLCVTERSTLDEIAEFLRSHGLKSAPVLRNGKLVGIVSETSLAIAAPTANIADAKPAPGPDDKEIGKEIRLRMNEASRADFALVRVLVRGRIVALWGLVRCDAHRRALRQLVATVPGVKRVDDHLGIQSSATGS